MAVPGYSQRPWPGAASLSLTLRRGSRSKKMVLTALEGIKCAKVSDSRAMTAGVWRSTPFKAVQTGRWSHIFVGIIGGNSDHGYCMGFPTDQETHYYGDQLNGYKTSQACFLFLAPEYATDARGDAVSMTIILLLLSQPPWSAFLGAVVDGGGGVLVPVCGEAE